MFCCLLGDKSLRSLDVFWGTKACFVSSSSDKLAKCPWCCLRGSVQTLLPDWGWMDSKHCMVAVSCKPGMKLSFGVTLVKVQFFCENPTEILWLSSFQIYLSQTPLCPNPVFDLMLKCWSRDIKDRPTFDMIHQFLLEQMESNIWLQERGKLLRTEWLWGLFACPSQSGPYFSRDVHGSCSFSWPWSDTQDQRISFGWKKSSPLLNHFLGILWEGFYWIPIHLWAKGMSKTWRDSELSPGGRRRRRSVRALPLESRFPEGKTAAF